MKTKNIDKYLNFKKKKKKKKKTQFVRVVGREKEKHICSLKLFFSSTSRKFELLTRWIKLHILYY